MEFLSLRKAFFTVAALSLLLGIGTPLALLAAGQLALPGSALAVAVALCLAAVAIIAAAAFLGNFFGRRAEKVVEALQLMARGDLSHKLKIKGKDEFSWLAYTYDCARKSLLELVGQIVADAREVASAANKLAAASGQISEHSQRQSEAATAMAASVEEVTASIAGVAGHTQSARQLCEQAGHSSRQGSGVIHEVVKDMHELAQAVSRSAEIVQDLGRQSERVRSIISVINEIADQTNLLALNAAIEAARAGEQGRGFAVVADEVRKLAERTGSSTKEIAAMIDGVRHGMEQAVGTMNEGVTRVSAGVVLATRAGDSINEIDANTRQVVAAVNDISSAMQGQSLASGEITRSVDQIAHMAKENSAAIRDTDATAKDLAALADRLQSVVARFKV
jgi:methyl-accepting chemotaxis protein